MKYFFSALKIIYLSLFTLFFIVLAFLCIVFKSHIYFHKIARLWGKTICLLSGIRVKIIGEIPIGEQFVYMANHTSDFDIPILLYAIKDDFRIIYKKSLENIFLFGWMLRLGPYISIERDNPQKAGRSLIEAINVMRQGSSILIFPEGTRQSSGVFQPLKTGGFQIAKKAGKLIVPIAVSNAYKIQPKLFKIPALKIEIRVADTETINQVNSTNNIEEQINLVYTYIKNNIKH